MTDDFNCYCTGYSDKDGGVADLCKRCRRFNAPQGAMYWLPVQYTPIFRQCKNYEREE